MPYCLVYTKLSNFKCADLMFEYHSTSTHSFHSCFLMVVCMNCINKPKSARVLVVGYYAVFPHNYMYMHCWKRLSSVGYSSNISIFPPSILHSWNQLVTDTVLNSSVLHNYRNIELQQKAWVLRMRLTFSMDMLKVSLILSTHAFCCSHGQKLYTLAPCASTYAVKACIVFTDIDISPLHGF